MNRALVKMFLDKSYNGAMSFHIHCLLSSIDYHLDVGKRKEYGNGLYVTIFNTIERGVSSPTERVVKQECQKKFDEYWSNHA